MVESKTICDICKKEVKPYNASIEDGYRYGIDVWDGVERRDVDLCDECYRDLQDSFKEWLQQRRHYLDQVNRLQNIKAAIDREKED